MTSIAYLIFNTVNMSKSNPNKLFQMIKQGKGRPITQQEQTYIIVLIFILVSWLLIIGIGLF